MEFELTESQKDRLRQVSDEAHAAMDDSDLSTQQQWVLDVVTWLDSKGSYDDPFEGIF
jgi:hypothetical protein